MRCGAALTLRCWLARLPRLAPDSEEVHLAGFLQDRGQQASDACATSETRVGWRHWQEYPDLRPGAESEQVEL